LIRGNNLTNLLSTVQKGWYTGVLEVV